MKYNMQARRWKSRRGFLLLPWGLIAIYGTIIMMWGMIWSLRDRTPNPVEYRDEQFDPNAGVM